MPTRSGESQTPSIIPPNKVRYCFTRSSRPLERASQPLIGSFNGQRPSLPCLIDHPYEVFRLPQNSQSQTLGCLFDSLIGVGHPCWHQSRQPQPNFLFVTLAGAPRRLPHESHPGVHYELYNSLSMLSNGRLTDIKYFHPTLSSLRQALSLTFTLRQQPHQLSSPSHFEHPICGLGYHPCNMTPGSQYMLPGSSPQRGRGSATRSPHSMTKAAQRSRFEPT